MACIIWCGTTYNNVLNLVDDILLHDAWCMGDGNNYSGPPCIDATLVFAFCMISFISKGGVKFHMWM